MEPVPTILASYNAAAKIVEKIGIQTSDQDLF